ncbi:MAG: hypothetical protein L0Z50_21705 [Verrucomicrobiales bacterium]|nr:hypothetical protein [Verrucomicrobiales bacterium]
MAVGVVLLSLLVLPKLDREGPVVPLVLRFLRYETNTVTAQTVAVVEAKNDSSQTVCFGISQPEFRRPAHPWEATSLETNYPLACVNPREASVFRIHAPREAQEAAWRLPFHYSITSSPMQQRLDRIFSVLKLKKAEGTSWPPPLAGVLYSEEFPPAISETRH